MRKRSVIRDTIKMTAVQFVLECLALWFQSWMTRVCGQNGGILALAGSFFQLAAMAAGGNAMLCASRFVSEELGRTGRCPARVLRHGLCFFAGLLAVPVSTAVYWFAPELSRQFLRDAALADAVRMMALLLPLWGYCACLRGYFNAVCRVAVPALCECWNFCCVWGFWNFFCATELKVPCRSVGI